MSATSATTPRAAVIIPTHNRRESLARTLAAFERQTCDPDSFEVIVVANACTDDTAAFVTMRRAEVPYALRVIDRPEPGVSAARNAGANRTRAALLVFLDDDIEPSPHFVEAHLEAHLRHGRTPGAPRVVIGYLPSVLQPEGDLFAIALRSWWEAMFASMRGAGHRYRYSNLLSGNLSLPRELFHLVGGFDVRFRCHEDYELGYRLIKSGAEFVFAEAASGVHADHTRLERACGRKRDEGYADVHLAQRYPELRTILLLARPPTLKQRTMRWAAFHAPRVGDAAAQTLMDLLPLVERLGMRMLWQRLLYGVFAYWYARGLADALPRNAEVDRLLEGAWEQRRHSDAERVAVPLDQGVDAAERLLDEHRPMAASLTLAGREFGQLAYQPGAEPLAGRHLRQELATVLYREYVEALIAAGQLQVFPPPVLPPSPAHSLRGDPQGALPVATRSGISGNASI